MNAPTRIDAPALAGADAAIRFFSLLADGASDGAWVAHLDDDARCIELTQAPQDRSTDGLGWQKIMADARRLGSAGIVTAQCRPADRPPLDRGSMRSTIEPLAVAAEACGVTLLDHLLFTGDRIASFRRMGLI